MGTFVAKGISAFWGRRSLNIKSEKLSVLEPEQTWPKVRTLAVLPELSQDRSVGMSLRDQDMQIYRGAPGVVWGGGKVYPNDGE